MSGQFNQTEHSIVGTDISLGKKNKCSFCEAVKEEGVCGIFVR